jgi:dihydroxyacid dehydratase/phosphogluconate dehydratase
MLRSNFEPGSSRWATRRAQWRALGLTDEDMAKPKVAIVNSSSDLAICYSHLDEIAKRAKDAVRRAGGLAFEIRTAAPSDFITSAGHRGGYILSSRDLIVNDIEVAVEGALLDGMACLASCDKTAPGQLMAAGRLNIPTIVVACGYQPCGRYRGGHCDIEEVFLQASHLTTGGTTLAELTEMSENAIAGPGVCAGMGTANSMHIVCEALGMALPGSTPVLANSEKMWAAVEESARRIVEMVLADVRPRDVLTPEAFANAVMVVLAVSGSINTVKHLQAIAREAECDVDVYELFERYPIRCRCSPPSGRTVSTPSRSSRRPAARGPLALVQNGDRIVIDIDKRFVDLDVPETELAARREQPLRAAEAAERGWLSIYHGRCAPSPKVPPSTPDPRQPNQRCAPSASRSRPQTAPRRQAERRSALGLAARYRSARSVKPSHDPPFRQVGGRFQALRVSHSTRGLGRRT